jgi:Fe-S cluster assembly protein SufD
LQGERASCNFFGVNIGREQEVYKVALNITHKASNTRSAQHYNQVLGDRAKGSFDSKVTIPAFLSGIEAHQLNKNLLLGDKSEGYSKPEMDVHSDDVIASHGATIGNIDEDAMAYLKSRGICHKEAEKLILHGFLRAVFENKELDEEEYRSLVHMVAYE